MWPVGYITDLGNKVIYKQYTLRSKRFCAV